MAVLARAPLLEREEHLERLGAALDGAASGRGSLILVAGEAGVGKTALVSRFRELARDRVRVLDGACDSLFTPRPLAPIGDIAHLTGGPLSAVVQKGGRAHEVLPALLDELSTQPTLAVLEDLHWGDEATLDLVRLLARRIADTEALVVGTYRDDELGPAHPLRLVLGAVTAAPSVTTLRVPRLSAAAVRELAAPHGVDADNLFDRTGGNAFFVTEALASGDDDVPATVRDAVLARAAMLDEGARRVLDAVAVVPPRAEVALLEAMVDEDVTHLDGALMSGMLVYDGDAVAFRHELARLAIEEMLGPVRRRHLHRLALRALRASGADLARLAHHAEACGDGEAVSELAPLAAERASALGAHREAAAQYERVLRFGAGIEGTQRAELLEAGAHECHLADRYADAIAWIDEAIELYRAARDRRGEARALRELSSVARCGGQRTLSEQSGRRAVELLELSPDRAELAAGYANLAMLAFNAFELADAVTLGKLALDRVDPEHDVTTHVHALNTVGTAELISGRRDGLERLARSLSLATDAGLEEHIGRALIHLADVAAHTRDYELADRYLRDGLDYCTERGLDLWLRYLNGSNSRIALDQGRWNDAIDAIPADIVEPGTPLPRIGALTVLGLVRARRGDPGVWEALDEARDLATAAIELQFVLPVAAARAEAAWLAGDLGRVLAETQSALDAVRRLEVPWWAGELACWRRRAGAVEDPPSQLAEPWALELAGDWAGAARAWNRLGCPYDEALALAQGDEEALLRAHEMLLELGAAPAAAIVARRLRTRGIRGITRGPRKAARSSPAGLTSRETEILALMAEGLANREIGARLFLSTRTVEHHVSAVLRKLEAHTRGEAVAIAARRGLLEDR